MSKCRDEVDAVLRALADPTRRSVVERLAMSPASVSELAERAQKTLRSLMQHLGVLEHAGIVTSEKQGRLRTVSLRPGSLDVLGHHDRPDIGQALRRGLGATGGRLGRDAYLGSAWSGQQGALKGRTFCH